MIGHAYECQPLRDNKCMECTR